MSMIVLNTVLFLLFTILARIPAAIHSPEVFFNTRKKFEKVCSQTHSNIQSGYLLVDEVQ